MGLFNFIFKSRDARIKSLEWLNNHNRYVENKSIGNALNRAVDKIHDFEGHKRTPEAIRDELMGGSDERV